MSRCRSCGDPIAWMKLSGGNHPCNPRKLTIITASGILVKGYESHFSTCKQADSWRKSGKAKDKIAEQSKLALDGEL